jgi:hypothetical protein
LLLVFGEFDYSVISPVVNFVSARSTSRSLNLISPPTLTNGIILFCLSRSIDRSLLSRIFASLRLLRYAVYKSLNWSAAGPNGTEGAEDLAAVMVFFITARIAAGE